MKQLVWAHAHTTMAEYVVSLQELLLALQGFMCMESQLIQQISAARHLFYVIKMAVIMLWLILYSPVKPRAQPLTEAVLHSRPTLNRG